MSSELNDITDYPSGWRSARLADCVKINPESLGSGTPETYEFRYIDISSVEKGIVDWDEVETHTYETAPSRAKRIVRSGDVLLSTVRPTLQGHTYAEWGRSGEFVCSTGFSVLRAGPEVEPSYLRHLVFSDIVDRQLRERITGSNYPAVRSSDVEEVEIPLPEISEQRRIADVLDTVDAAIQETDSVVEKQEQVKTGLLQDLFTRGLDANGRLRDPEREPEVFRETELGITPKAWEVKQVGELAAHVSSGSTPKGGKKVYQQEGIPFIRSQNVWSDGLDLNDVALIPREIHEDMTRTQLQAHDVLLNITGASIGRCCVVPPCLGEANVNQHVCIVRLPKADFRDSHFLSRIIASHIGQQQIKRLQAGGSREGLNYSQLKSFVVPWPSKKERRMIVDRIETARGKQDEEKVYRGKLQHLKTGLMQDLLTGRVRVPEAEARVDEVVA